MVKFDGCCSLNDQPSLTLLGCRDAEEYVFNIGGFPPAPLLLLLLLLLPVHRCREGETVMSVC